MIEHEAPSKSVEELLAIPTAADLEFEAELDTVLDERDALARLVAGLRASPDNRPTELIAQYEGLQKYPALLAATAHKIAVLRGDFLDGDPAANGGVNDRGAPRALRIYLRSEHLKKTHGTKRWRAVLQEEEGCGPSNIKRLVAWGRKLFLEQNQPKRRRT